MTEEADTSGTPTEQARGSGETKSEYVSRKAYEKTVAAEKNLRSNNRELSARLAEFEAKEQALAEEKMIEEKKFLEMIEQQKARIQELEGTVTTQSQSMQDFQKMTAVMGMFQEKGINLESKYMDLVPIQKIQLTDDGAVDVRSVSEVVSNFQQEHPRLVTPLSKLLPNDKSGSIKGQMSVDEWKKLDFKEKQKAWKEGRVKHGLDLG